MSRSVSLSYTQFQKERSMRMHRYQISIDYNYVFCEYTCTALNFRSSVTCITHGKIFLQVLKIWRMVVSEVITIATQTVHNTPDMIIIQKSYFYYIFKLLKEQHLKKNKVNSKLQLSLAACTRKVHKTVYLNCKFQNVLNSYTNWRKLTTLKLDLTSIKTKPHTTFQLSIL